MRSPERLLQQTEQYLRNIGTAQSLGVLLKIDPLFKKYLEEECGLNTELVAKMSELAEDAANSLKREDGIVTVESITAWQAKQPDGADTLFSGGDTRLKKPRGGS